MTHRATADFWRCYNGLPEHVQRQADRCYALLKVDSNHPSLLFKSVGAFRSARIGLHHPALARVVGADVVWFWIGSHAEYDRLVARS